MKKIALLGISIFMLSLCAHAETASTNAPVPDNVPPATTADASDSLPSDTLQFSTLSEASSMPATVEDAFPVESGRPENSGNQEDMDGEYYD
jgi:hypothetical protein